jgi:hypothetical protein
MVLFSLVYKTRYCSRKLKKLAINISGSDSLKVSWVKEANFCTAFEVLKTMKLAIFLNVQNPK